MKYFFTKYRFFLSGAALILTAASCTSTLSDEPATDARAISFTPAAETRAAVDGTTLPANSSFSVWGWYGTGNAINNNVFNGNTVTKSGGAWSYDGGTQYWIPRMTYNFYGVYPVYPQKSSDNGTTATVDNTGKITVTNFDCSATGKNAVDLMTATAQGNGSTPEPVAMPFQHELARVNIIVTSEGDAVTISNAQLYGISHKGTLKGSNWELSQESDKANPSFTEQTLNINDTQDHLLFGGDLLLPPHNTLSDNVTLDFSYQYTTGDTASKSASIKLKTNSVITWEKGKRYNYRINIPRNATDVNLRVEVANWEEKNYTVEW